MTTDKSERFAFRSQPISQLLVKVAARCNIDCSYCYWFRDAAVYDKPKLMSADVLRRLLQRIEEHVSEHFSRDQPGWTGAYSRHSPSHVSRYRHPRSGGTGRSHACHTRHWRKRFGSLQSRLLTEAVRRVFLRVRSCQLRHYDP